MATSGKIFIHVIDSGAPEDVEKPTESVTSSQMVFTDRDAAIFCYFYKDRLTHLQTKFGASVRKESSERPCVVKKLVILYKEEQSDNINSVIETMKLDMRSLSTKEFLVETEKLPKLTEYLRQIDSKDLILTDLAIKKVIIIAKSNEEAEAAEDDLKTFIGMKKPTTVASTGSKSFTCNTPSSPTTKYTHSENYKWMSSSFSNHSAEKTFSKPDSNDLNFECRLRNGFVLKVYKASILQIDVDVIVNAANESLSHGGGVALVIADKAGYRFKDECRDYINASGNLKVCGNCVTSAGNLKYRGIIHAVGPTWHSYHDKVACLDDLYDCIMNIFSTCNERHFQSVGMPAISTGIFGVPKELCADMYVKAAVNYSATLGSESVRCLMELHFIDIDEEILRFVRASYNRWKQNPDLIDQRHTVPKYQSLPEVKVNRHRDRKGRGHNWSTGNFQGEGHSEVASSNLGHHGSNVSYISEYKIPCDLKKMGMESHSNARFMHVFKIAENIDLKLYTSEIEKVTDMDAIVCGIDKSLQSSGYVMTAIKKAGGRVYDESFQKMVNFNSQKVKYNDVVKCRGGNLGAKYVIFLVMDKILNADKKEVEWYQQGIVKMLETVRDKDKDWKIRRIAMPLIGTGLVETNAGKLRMCVEALLKSICEFCCRNAKGSLGDVVSEIHLVNNNSTVSDVLLDVFHKVAGVNASRQPSDLLPPSYYSSSTIAEQEIDRSSEMESDESVNHCQPCLIKDTTTSATWYCENCDEYYCNECHHGHERYASLKTHVFKAAKHVKNRHLIQMFKAAELCKKHNKVLEFYCQDENQLCCNTCAITSHRRCKNVVEINAINIEQKKQNDWDVMKKLNKVKDKNLSIIQSITKAEQGVCEQADNIAQNLEVMRCRFLERFDKFAKKAIEMSSTVKDKKISEFQEKVSICEGINQTLTQTLDLIDYIMHHGTPTQQFVVKHKLEEQLLEFQVTVHELSLDIGITNMSVQFAKPINDILYTQKDIGIVNL